MSVIIVHNVVVALFTCICIIGLPVVNNVVSKIHNFILRYFMISRSTESWQPALMVGQEVVVKRCTLSSPDASIAMFSFLVNRFVETFRYQAPLHSKIFIVISCGNLIGCPTE